MDSDSAAKSLGLSENTDQLQCCLQSSAIVQNEVDTVREKDEKLKSYLTKAFNLSIFCYLKFPKELAHYKITHECSDTFETQDQRKVTVVCICAIFTYLSKMNHASLLQ